MGVDLKTKNVYVIFSYGGGRSANDFFNFLKEKVEADRVGRVDVLDAIVKNFQLADNK